MPLQSALGWTGNAPLAVLTACTMQKRHLLWYSGPAWQLTAACSTPCTNFGFSMTAI